MTQSTQPYTPLTKEELNKVDKVLKTHCKGLCIQVYSQLSQQEHNLHLQRAHTYKISATLADQLRDMADSVETLEDHECDNE